FLSRSSLSLPVILCSFVSPRCPPTPTLFPYTTLFRSVPVLVPFTKTLTPGIGSPPSAAVIRPVIFLSWAFAKNTERNSMTDSRRSEEHTSELQSRENLVCRLLLEKKKQGETLDYSLYR